MKPKNLTSAVLASMREPTNEERAQAALNALRANCIHPDDHEALFEQLTESCAHDVDRECVVDLLANLMHYCADSEITFADAMRMAEIHFEEEQSKGGPRR
jgi:hypothetical protein